MGGIKEREEFEQYTKIKLLGEGSFGKAYLVTRNSDGLQCVMKQIDIGKLSETKKNEDDELHLALKVSDIFSK